jgi:hypothetical protein
VSVQRGIDGSEPVRPEATVAGAREERRSRSSRLAAGTLACPSCDAPVALTTGPVSPADALACPFCAHAGAVRDFLSLSAPSRPARVEVRVVRRSGLGAWSA